VVEEIKWRKPPNGMLGVPMWSHGGIICTGETYKKGLLLRVSRRTGRISLPVRPSIV